MWVKLWVELWVIVSSDRTGLSNVIKSFLCNILKIDTWPLTKTLLIRHNNLEDVENITVSDNNLGHQKFCLVVAVASQPMHIMHSKNSCLLYLLEAPNCSKKLGYFEQIYEIWWHFFLTYRKMISLKGLLSFVGRRVSFMHVETIYQQNIKRRCVGLTIRTLDYSTLP